MTVLGYCIIRKETNRKMSTSTMTQEGNIIWINHPYNTSDNPVTQKIKELIRTNPSTADTIVEFLICGLQEYQKSGVFSL